MRALALPGVVPACCLCPQVQHQALQDCLTKHSIIIRGEFVIRPLNITQAADRRDAFVKVVSFDPSPLPTGLCVHLLNMAGDPYPHWWSTE